MDIQSALKKFSGKQILSRRPFLLIVFAIFFIILIAFGSSIYQRRLHLAPAGFVVSNVDSHRATVSFVTASPEKACVFWFSLWLPRIVRVCDQEKTRVHYLPIGSLAPDTRYHAVITSGISWWRLVSVQPTPAKSVDMQPIPSFQTLSNNIEVNQNTTQIISGTIVDEAGVLQSDAVVTVSTVKSNTVWSTRTSHQGTFSLSIPKLTLLDHVGVSVWSASGFISQDILIMDFLSDNPVISVLAYEQ